MTRATSCSFVLKRGDVCSNRAMKDRDVCFHHKNREPFKLIRCAHIKKRSGDQCSRPPTGESKFCTIHRATDDTNDTNAKRCGFITFKGTPCMMGVSHNDRCSNHRHKEPYKACKFCGGSYRNKYGACRRCPEGIKHIRSAEGRSYYRSLSPERKAERVVKERERLRDLQNITYGD